MREEWIVSRAWCPPHGVRYDSQHIFVFTLTGVLNNPGYINMVSNSVNNLTVYVIVQAMSVSKIKSHQSCFQQNCILNIYIAKCTNKLLECYFEILEFPHR